MKPTIATITLIFCSLATNAEELVKVVSLSEDPLTVTALIDEQSHSLVEIAEPEVTSPVYALKGMIRYTNVQGDAFLQMDNHFGADGTFFTKSLASAGPMRKISGSSDWRPFVLPFNAVPDDQADLKQMLPESLTLSLFLPGDGTVAVTDIALYQYAIGENPMQMEMQAGQWFSNQSAGWIGGIGGSLLGIWGALIGVVSSRGKARGFALGSANVLLLLGVASLVGGVVALATAQPYVVYYPLLLLGSIVVIVILMLRRTLAARYEQLELKRMQSMDA